MNKTIIPCLLDETPLSIHPYLARIKGIGFKDFNDGVGRLKIVLLNYMTRDFNIQDNDSIKLMNEFLGTLETASHLVHNENIKEDGTEAEKDFWVNKIMQTHDVSYEKLKKEESIGREVMKFLNQKMEEIQQNINDEQALGNITRPIMAIVSLTGQPDFKKYFPEIIPSHFRLMGLGI